MLRKPKLIEKLKLILDQFDNKENIPNMLWVLWVSRLTSVFTSKQTDCDLSNEEDGIKGLVYWEN